MNRVTIGRLRLCVMGQRNQIFKTGIVAAVIAQILMMQNVQQVSMMLAHVA